MSPNTEAINDFDSVVLDGMHDNKATKCWVRLLHHGVAFRIEASADNLNGTPLHQRWQALSEAEKTPGMTPSDRISRWDELCNLLIVTCLPVLQDLASKGLVDRSLRGCFRTPTYYLQLVRDSASQEVRASVVSGPIDESPYGFQAAKKDDLGALAAGLKQYSSHDIEIVRDETYPSMAPKQVKTSEGTVHHFKACMQDSKRLGTDHISNTSRNAIRTYLALHNDPLEAHGIPSVSGIVVDEGALSGILLQNVHAGEGLASRLSSITTVKELDRTRRLVAEWQARIVAVVAALHGRGYYLHDEIAELGIDESTLLVDGNDEIWLPLQEVFELKEGGIGPSDPMGKDKEAVRQVFERFVPGRLDGLEAQMGSQ